MFGIEEILTVLSRETSIKTRTTLPTWMVRHNNTMKLHKKYNMYMILPSLPERNDQRKM